MSLFIDTLEETITMLPLLFIMYFILEYLERHDFSLFEKLKKNGPLYGGLMGIIPQCGISVVASGLFLEGKITLGTLISVYIATSDEALPLLLTNPSLYSSTLYMVLLKLVFGIVFGYLIDYFIKLDYHKEGIIEDKQEESLLHSVVSRTLKIYLFIVVVHFALSYLFALIGEDNLSVILLNRSSLQPFVAALFGLIPHCIVSVTLTQLYAQGIVSFASLLSGLMSNAGMGLVVLVQNKIDMKVFGLVIALLLACSMVVGLILEMV